MYSMRKVRWPRVLIAMGALGLFLTGCRADTLPNNPTVIPSITVSPLPTRTPGTPASPLPPAATFRSILNPTSPPTAIAVALATLPPLPTLKPNCLVAKEGDSVVSLLSRGGVDLSVAAAFRALNNMPSGSNVIQIGETYCIPRATATPTPVQYEATQTIVARFVPTSGALVTQIYTVVKGDTAGGLEFKLGVSLSLICRLNPLPDGLNCSGCDPAAPIYQSKCRPILAIGQRLNVPAPPLPPSITPTLTGSETATPTPSYRAPELLSPVNGAPLSGTVRLEWLTVGVLQPDESYLVLMTDATIEGQPRNFQYVTNATSVLIPPADAPVDSSAHTYRWQVSVVRALADGSVITLSKPSPAWAFVWANP